MISRFSSEKARKRFHEVYDSVLDWPLPAKDVTVGTSFGPTYLRRSGDPGSPPLLLLPGMCATSLSWQEHVAELSARNLVYAVDPIGEAGRSEQTAPIRDAEAVAKWLKEVIDGLGHDEVHLMGVSRGGWVALNQAIHEPGRIASVTAVDPAGFHGRKVARYLFALLLLMFAPRFVRRRIKAESNYQPAAEELLRRVTLAQLTYQKKAFMVGTFTEDDLRAITVPTKVVLAGKSVVLDANQTKELLRRANPAIDVEIVAGVGHGRAVIDLATSAVAG
jgi:pimeloyl-ACP methyl ester carboxylesterase